MMNVEHARGIRIVSRTDNKHGWGVIVTDAETGAQVENVYRIVLMLDARELNVAKVYYHRQNADGRYYIDEETGKFAAASCIRQYPEVDVFAYEMRSEIECPHCGTHIKLE